MSALDRFSSSSLYSTLNQAKAILNTFDELIQGVKYPYKVFSLLALQEAFFSFPRKEISWEAFLYAIAKEKQMDLVQETNIFSELIHKPPRRIITSKYICHLHEMFFTKKKREGVGEFRLKQNWIGPEGEIKEEEAVYYPPPPKEVPKKMRELQAYLLREDIDPLIQTALYFAQFLVIHPFMNGNGRVIRSLIPCILYQKKVLSYPFFYMSRYFKIHRELYSDSLFAISAKGCWKEWVKFFLQGVIQEGEALIDQVRTLFDLYITLMSSVKNKSLISICFTCPIFTLQNDQKALKELKEIGFVVDDDDKKGAYLCPYLIDLPITRTTSTRL